MTAAEMTQRVCYGLELDPAFIKKTPVGFKFACGTCQSRRAARRDCGGIGTIV
jgi:hypothetical protein